METERQTFKSAMRLLRSLVENKFDAAFTNHQPAGYLKILKSNSAKKKILTFLVPGWRKKEIEKAVKHYSSTNNGGIRIRVCVWEELAELLTASFSESELIREFSRGVLQKCNMQSPLNMNELMVASDVLEQWLNQRELLKAIREQLQVEPIFKGMQIQLQGIRSGTPTNVIWD